MKIIGLMPVYNDEDIVGEVIEHLISQGLELVVLDNGSTDKTYEICKKYLGKGILKLSQYKSSQFQPDLIYRMLYHMALTQSPDWVIRSDSDELLESGIKNITLKDAITQADSEGYNLIQFDRFDFFMTDDDNESAKSVKEKLTYYSYLGDFAYRAWKYFPGIRIGDVVGHYPIFPGEYRYKIFPKKFLFRHYTFRSEEQAKKKMETKLRGRGNVKKDQLPLHDRHKKILKQNFSKKINHNLLTKYNEDGKWNLEIKFNPYDIESPPKRQELFSEDGTLKVKQKSVYEYRLLLSEKQSTWFLRVLQRRWGTAKRIFSNKIRKISGQKFEN